MKSSSFLPLSEELMEYSHRIGRVLGDDPHLLALAEYASKDEYANMNTALEQVTFIQLLARQMKAKTCVEVGVYLGLTTLALAQVADRVIGLELRHQFIDQCAPFWEKAGVRNKIDIRIGPALESLEQLSGDEWVDLVYIDCNKPQYSSYVEHALRLVRVNGVVLVDNTLWKGKVLDANDTEPNTVGVREVNELIQQLDPRRFKIVNLPVGDGLTLILKLCHAVHEQLPHHEAATLTREQWHSLCVTGKPFRVAGVKHGATTRWTEDYLAAVAHDEPVKVTTRKQFDETSEMSWSEAIHAVFRGPRTLEDGSLYLQQTHPPAALEHDIAVPVFFPRNTQWERGLINVWISQACDGGSRTIAHYDPLDNLLCVLEGSKHVRLWPPAALPRIFDEKRFDAPSHQAFVESERDQKERRKVYANLEYVAETFDPTSLPPYWEGTVHAGESLMIPSHWVHSVTSAPGLCVAINFWIRTALGFDADAQRKEEKVLADVKRFLLNAPSSQIASLRLTKLQMEIERAKRQAGDF